MLCTVPGMMEMSVYFTCRAAGCMEKERYKEGGDSTDERWQAWTMTERMIFVCVVSDGCY